jgi:hypothetical protein
MGIPPMGELPLPRCHTCNLAIRMQYSVNAPQSSGQGYWSHFDTPAGIAADKDHEAVR